MNKEYIDLIIAAMDRHGLTNQFFRKALLGIVSKENPTLVNELSYANTPVGRLRTTFGSKLKDLSDDEISALKRDDVRFYEVIYGNRYGNNTFGDGYKYRGRGFNGITFKGIYQSLQDIYVKQGSKLGTINIVENPDKLNDPEIAAEFLVLYYIWNFGKRPMNQYTDQQSAIVDCIRCNAGWGTSMQNKIIQEGLARATQWTIDNPDIV